MILQSLNGLDRTSVFVPAPSQPQQRLRVAELCIELLISQTKLRQLWTEGYQEAGRHLQTLAMAADDYRLTRQHLDNALAYCQAHEFAAAAFELRMVRGRLHRM